MYHAVGTALPNDSYGISIEPTLFEKHVRSLTEDPHLHVTTLRDSFRSTDDTKIVLTFDDGYLDTLRVAAPLLVDLSLPFTVFVTSGFLEFGHPEYLRPADLQELSALPGVTIGSHTENHPRLTRCSNDELRRELAFSRERLEDCIGTTVNVLSYPHGDVDERVRSAAISAGYVLAAGSRFDINPSDRDQMNLCRSEIVAGDTERVFIQKVYGAWDWYRYRDRDLPQDARLTGPLSGG